MIEITIPGRTPLQLNHLVLDYNGTLALDGELLKQCIPALKKLQEKLTIHVLTADTYGTVKEKTSLLQCEVQIIGADNQEMEKLHFIKELNSKNVVAMGNGRNDLLMLREAALGIGLIQQEGAYGQTIMNADIICTNIVDALTLLTNESRLIATLRN